MDMRLLPEAARMQVLEGRCAMTNYEKLFGTPERAALTLVERLDVGVIEWCNDDCYNCPYEFNPYGCEQVLTLLEWLEGESYEA